MALPQNAIFTGDDIGGAIHRTVPDDDVVAAEKIVWGRVKGLLGLDARPASLDETLAGQVLELGLIAYANPEALTRYILEGEESIYDNGRWDQILEAVAGGGTTAPGAAPRPRGSFPAAPCYPDPTYAVGRRRAAQ